MRKPGKKIAILVAPLLSFAALAAQAPSAHAATTAYEISSDHTTTCLADNGGSLLLVNNCAPAASVNHAALWIQDDEGFDSGRQREMFRLRNVHNSTQCLTETTGGGTIVAACGTNHVQFWEFIADPGGGYQEVLNVHFNNLLTDSGDPVWHFSPTSV